MGSFVALLWAWAGHPGESLFYLGVWPGRLVVQWELGAVVFCLMCVFVEKGGMFEPFPI